MHISTFLSSQLIAGIVVATMTPVSAQPVSFISPAAAVVNLSSNEALLNDPASASAWGWGPPTTADKAFATATWGALLNTVAGPTAKAQILCRAIVDAMEGHRGNPSTSFEAETPFQRYRDVVASPKNAAQPQVYCADMSAIFTYACTCFGIPARVIGSTNSLTVGTTYVLQTAAAHSTSEIYDSDKGRWIWMDVTLYILGVQNTRGEYLSLTEIWRAIADPGLFSALSISEYLPGVGVVTTNGPSYDANVLHNGWLENFFSKEAILSYQQSAGSHVSFTTNELFVYPEPTDLQIKNLQPLPLPDVGISLALIPGPRFSSITSTQTYSNYPLSTNSVAIAGTTSSNVTTFVLKFAQPNALPTNGDPLANSYQFFAANGTSSKSSAYNVVLQYNSSGWESNHGQPGALGGVTVTSQPASGLPLHDEGSAVSDWVIDEPSSQDQQYAQNTWGGSLSSSASTTQNARSLALTISNALQTHLGSPSDSALSSPFDLYRLALGGSTQVSGPQIASIFSYACNSLGMPARVVLQGGTFQSDSGAFQIDQHACNEIFDPGLNRWVWMDLSLGLIGADGNDGYGALGAAELQRRLNDPASLALLSSTIIANGTSSSQAITAVASYSALATLFAPQKTMRYVGRISASPVCAHGRSFVADFNGDGIPDKIVQDGSSITLFLATGRSAPSAQFSVVPLWTPGVSFGGFVDPTAEIIVGDFNGDGKSDFIIHNSQYVTLFLATGNSSGPFTAVPLWYPGSNYGGWGDPGAKIVVGDFNGDGKTDFIIHDALYGALFTATGNPSQPFTWFQLWGPTVHYGGWGDAGAEIIVGDFNGDGKSDFIIHNSQYGALFTATGASQSPFSWMQLWGPGVYYGGWGDPGAKIVAGDFNGDGVTDFIIHDSSYGALFTATKNPGAPFSWKQLWGPGISLAGWSDAGANLITLDSNRDGKTDFVAYDASGCELFTSTGNPNAPFTGQILWNSP